MRQERQREHILSAAQTFNNIPLPLGKVCLGEIGNAKVGAAVGDQSKGKLLGNKLIFPVGLHRFLLVRRNQIRRLIAMGVQPNARMAPNVAVGLPFLDFKILGRQHFVQCNVPAELPPS